MLQSGSAGTTAARRRPAGQPPRRACNAAHELHERSKHVRRTTEPPGGTAKARASRATGCGLRRPSAGFLITHRTSEMKIIKVKRRRPQRAGRSRGLPAPFPAQRRAGAAGKLGLAEIGRHLTRAPLGVYIRSAPAAPSIRYLLPTDLALCPTRFQADKCSFSDRAAGDPRAAIAGARPALPAPTPNPRWCNSSWCLG